MSIPTFENLTLDPSGPLGNAWGLFGPDNELGMLNLLTPKLVKRAASEEIREGVRVSLDLPLNRLSHPSFGRKPFTQELVNKAPRVVNDDILTFNTQTSTQWDGFRHFGNQTHGCYFNGHNLDNLKSSRVLGIDAWSNTGGIIGRGILLDYATWATKNHIPLTPFTTSTIPLSSILEVLKETNLTPRSGDILFIRTGFTEAFSLLTSEEEAALAARPTPDFAGIENGEKTLRWLWENQFAAIASDSPSFEPAPLVRADCAPEETLHQWCLSGWGMPIGEYFDLEELTKKCRERGRWSFFLSSVPLKVPGGVASPPNAVAII
ncbi:putative cyclase-domain-containing protein [Aspergillus californicus]